MASCDVHVFTSPDATERYSTCMAHDTDAVRPTEFEARAAVREACAEVKARPEVVASIALNDLIAAIEGRA